MIIVVGFWMQAAAEQVNSSPEDDTSLQIKPDYETWVHLLLQTLAYIIKYLVNI